MASPVIRKVTESADALKSQSRPMLATRQVDPETGKHVRPLEIDNAGVPVAVGVGHLLGTIQPTAPIAEPKALDDPASLLMFGIVDDGA